MAALLAPLAWFVALTMLYALATAVCAGIVSRAPWQAVTAATILVASSVLIGWIAWLGSRRWTDANSLGKLALLLAVLSLVGTLWLALPLIMQLTCATS
jgi:hypothetical protein